MNGVQHIQSVNREKSIFLMFEITQEELNRRLDYDPSTGDLVWVIPTPEEAAAAYDKEALSFFGAFARTNKELGLLWPNSMI